MVRMTVPRPVQNWEGTGRRTAKGHDADVGHRVCQGRHGRQLRHRQWRRTDPVHRRPAKWHIGLGARGGRGFGRRLRTGNHCRSACQHPVPVALALHEQRRDRCGSRLRLRRGLCRNGFPRRRAHSPSAADAPAPFNGRTPTIGLAKTRASLAGSERVRRHPHRRTRSGPPSGVSRGPRAFGSGSPSSTES